MNHYVLYLEIDRSDKDSITINRAFYAYWFVSIIGILQNQIKVKGKCCKSANKKTFARFLYIARTSKHFDKFPIRTT